MMNKEKHEQLLTGLNEKQQLAVLHREGPALVLAGAGSGKTRVLTTRVAHLICDMAVRPTEILLVTFTNKAAAEMKGRVAALTNLELPFSGTFHSLSAKILRRHAPAVGLDHNFTIYDADDQLALLKAIYKEQGWNVREYKPAAVLWAISAAKNKLQTPADCEQVAHGDFGEFVARAYGAYQRRLKQEEAVDFDDLLGLTVRLLQENRDILQFYQENLRQVLVDEYQDTNKAQYLLTKLLTAPQNNLFVVGDFSQSIYTWRGADLTNMLNLEKDFAGLVKYDLDQNYRSHQTILSAATAVIEKNAQYPVLNLWTERKEAEALVVFDTPTTNTEAATVVREIKKLSKDYSLNEMAVLYRTNAQSRAFEEALAKQALPYRLVGGFKFYERKEIKDLLAYLRLYVNPRESVSLARVLKVGKKRWRSFEDWRVARELRAAGASEEVRGSERAVEWRSEPSDGEEVRGSEREEMEAAVEGQEAEKPFVLLKEIIAAVRYKELFDKNDPEDVVRLENVDELLVSAAAFETAGQFLENIALIQDEQTPDKNLAKTSEERAMVTLMSLHSAKGLEFPVVFLVGMEEGLLPHSRSLFDASQLAEERRLAYVGMTRAKEKLYFSFARKRWFYGSVTLSVKSRFLLDIDESLLEVREVDDEEDQPKLSPFKRGFYQKKLRGKQKLEKPLGDGSERKLVIDDDLIDDFLRDDDADIATFLRS